MMTSALESSIHMPLSLWAPFKESVSHDSENGGNYYCRVGWRRPGRRKLGQNTNNQRHWRYDCAFRSRTEPSGQSRSYLEQVVFDTCKLALISYRGYGAGRHPRWRDAHAAGDWSPCYQGAAKNHRGGRPGLHSGGDLRHPSRGEPV